MISKYGIFCEVVRHKSFTKAADAIGYTQSGVSQIIRNLEKELGTTLIDRSSTTFSLTADGSNYFPYISSIYHAELSLQNKRAEILGMFNSVIRIGTVTSVSRNFLPVILRSFKQDHPDVQFVLRQGTYNDIEKWIAEGEVDFGFVIGEMEPKLEVRPLMTDHMVAVLPEGHPLCNKTLLYLRDLAEEPMILVGEGEFSLSMEGFQNAGVEPKIEYTVYDDYTVIAMVKQKLAISMMYQLTLTGFEDGLVLKPIQDGVSRTISVAWKNKQTIPYAARKLVNAIFDYSELKLND